MLVQMNGSAVSSDVDALAKSVTERKSSQDVVFVVKRGKDTVAFENVSMNAEVKYEPRRLRAHLVAHGPHARGPHSARLHRRLLTSRPTRRAPISSPEL